VNAAFPRRAPYPLMPQVSLRDISKSFSTVRAVDRVSLDVPAGEIHALLGENGAGKSTLMHVLSGLYRPDAGEIRLAGKLRHFPSPQAALAAGIAMVHQHFMLIPTLTIAQNILLALPGRAFDRVHTKVLNRRVLDLAAQYHVAINDPDAQVRTLSVGAQQRVEILKALASDARILILDEPTAVLTPAEVAQLFHTLQQLKSAGYLIILISHKIPEVLAISDRLSVLRQGRLVLTTETASCTPEQLANLMIGEHPSLADPVPISCVSPPSLLHQASVPCLALHHPSLPAAQGGIALRDISVSLHAGEIVGITGVDGNGQSELIELLIAVRTPPKGALILHGHPLVAPTPAQLRAQGVSLIPQDRRHEGLALSLAVEENLLLNTHLLTRLTSGLFLLPAAIRRFAEQQMTAFGIHPPLPARPVAALSGGNQQRVVIARELASHPQVIIAANPTRGLDIAAARYVHHALLARCHQGAAILIISTDLDEVLALSHRIYALYQGRLLGPVSPAVGHEQIGRMMTGACVPS
jgi:ABC-type uncharacterized transport system ATPase subunit